MIAQSALHGRGHSQRLVDADEVAIHEVQSDGIEDKTVGKWKLGSHLTIHFPRQAGLMRESISVRNMVENMRTNGFGADQALLLCDVTDPKVEWRRVRHANRIVITREFCNIVHPVFCNGNILTMRYMVLL